jgi:pyridoxal 5'-phosphate synthase pdxT subunit
LKIGVLGLQGDVREHVAAVASVDAAPLVVKRADELASVDGLIIPGGESTTIGKLLDRFGLLHPIIERARSGMPLYGTCAGLILMAKHVAGEQAAPHRLGVMDATVRRNAYGRQAESFETDIDIASFDGPFRAVFIRAPAIHAVGDGVDVLAEHDGEPVMVRQGHLLGSSFHPEMTGDTRVHRLFVSMVDG